MWGTALSKVSEWAWTLVSRTRREQIFVIVNPQFIVTYSGSLPAHTFRLLPQTSYLAILRPQSSHRFGNNYNFPIKHSGFCFHFSSYLSAYEWPQSFSWWENCGFHMEKIQKQEPTSFQKHLMRLMGLFLCTRAIPKIQASNFVFFFFFRRLEVELQEEPFSEVWVLGCIFVVIES